MHLATSSIVVFFTAAASILVGNIVHAAAIAENGGGSGGGGGAKVVLPLHRSAGFSLDTPTAMMRVHARYANMLNEENPAIVKSGLPKDPNAYSIFPVTSYAIDVSYYVQVGIGTPPQHFKLNLDTGSADLYVESTMCESCENDHSHLFNPSKSRTYTPTKEKWRIRYGDGSTANGIIGIDRLQLGKLEVESQMIELAVDQSEDLTQGPGEGILGLAFSGAASVKSIKTPMDNLVAQNRLQEPVFSLYLGNKKHGQDGEFIFGGYNADYVDGPFSSIPVNKSLGYWSIDVPSIQIGDTTITRNVQAIIDTGTTLIIFPKKLMEWVALFYGAERQENGILYKIDCDLSRLPSLTFNMGNGLVFTLPPELLIYRKDDDSNCQASFTSMEHDFLILGDIFLKQYYTVFDYQKPEIRIANLKQ